MLLSEMVRKIANEQILVSDSTSYSTTSTSWAALTSKTINLTTNSLVAIFCNLSNSNSSYITYLRVKVTIGGTDYYVYYGRTYTQTTGEPKGFLVALPSGSATITFEGKTSSSGTPCVINNIYIGVPSFPDVAQANLQTYSSPLNISLSSRKTCVGKIKNAVLLVNCAVAGSSVTVGTVSVDGVAYPWTQSASASDTAWGVLAVPVSTDQTHSVSLSGNSSGTSISIVLCPWILPGNDSEILSLSFPQGSTLYVTLEPLFLNPTKAVKIGKKRVVSFGDSTDYYYTTSGTDIVSASYTFESVEVGSCLLLVSGYGGCISIVGVDVR